MPANKKYLTVAVHQRFAKVSAAIFGAMILAACMHMAAAQWLGDYKVVVATFGYLMFPVWITLMILPFLFHNGWKCWLLYLLSITVFALLIYAGKLWHPVII